METIDTLIQDFKSKGWSNEQLVYTLETLSSYKPDEFRKQFANLVYLFAKLPLYNFDILEFYEKKEYSRLIHFAKDMVTGIEEKQ